MLGYMYLETNPFTAVNPPSKYNAAIKDYTASSIMDDLFLPTVESSALLKNIKDPIFISKSIPIVWFYNFFLLIKV